MMSRCEIDILSMWLNRSDIVVSICCTTFNHEKYLVEAIESFLMQETDFAFEIIIHDDSSLDDTQDIIRAYAKAYPTIIKTIFQESNQYSQAGLILPRFVFPAASGKYLAICEGDDYWTDKQKLQKQVAFLESNSDYVITYTACQAFDETGYIDVDYGGARRDLSALELKQANSIATLTACFRNVILEVPSDLLSARYGDSVIWSLLGHYGKGKYLDDIKPAAYRVHDQGLHSKKNDQARATMGLITFSALHSHYVRTGDSELAGYFRIRMLVLILRSMGYDRLYRFIRGVYRIKHLLPKSGGVQ